MMPSKGNSLWRRLCNPDEINVSWDILIALTLVSWSFISIQSFQFAVDGSASIFGPGMGVFDVLFQLVLKFTDFTYVVWSICVAGVKSWSISEFVRALLMWQVMIAAMMVPTLVTLFDRRAVPSYPALLITKFVSGYLIAWMLFSIPAVIVQWALQVSEVLNNGMVIQSPILAGFILIGIGFLQLIAINRRRFIDLTVERKDLHVNFQTRPAYRLGLETGIECISRNWLLMTTMFVFGLMNIIAMAILTLVMVIEKFENNSRIFSNLGAVSLISLGFFYLIY